MKAARVEGVVQVVIMLAIGGAAGAASFTHVHNVAAAHGQGGWLAWADAVVLELMSIASGLEMRQRKRRRKPVLFPVTVLVCAVTLSISAQVVEAELSVIGWIAAALPALGFLVMVKIALGRTTSGPPFAADPSPASTRTAASHEASVSEVAHSRRTVVAAASHVTDDIDGCEDRRAHTVVRLSSAASVHGEGPAAIPSVPDTDLQSWGSYATVPDRSAEPPGSGQFDTAQIEDVVHVLPAAAAARDVLAEQGRPLTRKALTEQLRRSGHAVSNARASLLVKILKANVQIERQYK
ncbi:DUF2637 domain-containing protein [Phytohabitans kaempferiae]|uniref:DUF2637 domain-containing protein n=1 Tax=Phytohabitans kaempferiae TaxID=1620943 RepID=A0ABV6M7Y1_9ACTN